MLAIAGLQQVPSAEQEWEGKEAEAAAQHQNAAVAVGGCGCRWWLTMGRKAGGGSHRSNGERARETGNARPDPEVARWERAEPGYSGEGSAAGERK